METLQQDKSEKGAKGKVSLTFNFYTTHQEISKNQISMSLIHTS